MGRSSETSLVSSSEISLARLSETHLAGPSETSLDRSSATSLAGHNESISLDDKRIAKVVMNTKDYDSKALEFLGDSW